MFKHTSSDSSFDRPNLVKGAKTTFETARAENGRALYPTDKPANEHNPHFKAFFQKYEIAWNFYKSSGYDITAIPGHLNGIDFNHEVKVVPIPPPVQVQQFQSAKSSYQGNYYAPIGTPPGDLGIAAGGSKFDAVQKQLLDQALIKVPTIYDVVQPLSEKGRICALQSTAAPIIDTWSYKDKREIPTAGGATQFFSANRDAFKRQDSKLTAAPAKVEESEHDNDSTQRKRSSPF